MKEITSSANSEFKNLILLKSKAKHRKESGTFLVEGRREFERAVKSGYKLLSKYRSATILNDQDPWFDFFISNGPPETLLDSNLFEKLAVREGSEGVIGVFSEKRMDFWELEFSKKPIFLVLDGIQKPGNIGAIFRTADGAGVDGVLLSNYSGDLYNPNTIRASLGCVFSIPALIGDQTAVFNFLRNKDVQVFSAMPGPHPPLYDLDLNDGVALVFGSEDRGIIEGEYTRHGKPFNIPMKGIADSLNVSVSVGISVYEALRQRK